MEPAAGEGKGPAAGPPAVTQTAAPMEPAAEPPTEAPKLLPGEAPTVPASEPPGGAHREPPGGASSGPRGEPPKGQGWVERLLGGDVSRALGAMAGAVGRECNKDLAEAISGGIRDSLLSPVMDRVMRDLLPYMWCFGGLMAGLVTMMAAQLVVSLMILYRSSWGRRL